MCKMDQSSIPSIPKSTPKKHFDVTTYVNKSGMRNYTIFSDEENYTKVLNGGLSLDKTLIDNNFKYSD